ncbi:hypothetical protein PCIT_a0982 [Pseudoalteromonas citrea]|uniref:Alpha/beta hydrolase n=2 Tax=Pseudoalteromonas citrea TaxID=43655 RepID=A0AAD4ALH0_9GAMM|nr:alpha/beta hydrolase [Pseudoalteromonas citrea]KAF7774523.1 hypothetical protein PCIT_a0982 [Pseudoalteromonas citrea]
MKIHTRHNILLPFILCCSTVSFADTGLDIEQIQLLSGGSGISPPEEKLGTYVVDSGPGLDTGCTFKSGGPLVIELPVPKVVNDSVLVNGKIDPSKVNELINEKIISAKVQISMPVFDVDSDASVPGRNPEIDRVSFNGKVVGILQGTNGRWTETRLEVPIEEVDFLKPNLITVDIDVANPQDSWCMSVDWVALEFDVATPIVLAHGINSQSDSWDDDDAPGVITRLDELGVRYERYSVGKNGSTAGNAKQLATHINGLLDELKADKVHIIAHSKGGLDTQNMQAQGVDFEIESLSTFSTPHLGSVAADFSIIAMEHAATSYHPSGADPHGYANAYLTLPTFVGPQLPGIRDLTTDVAANAVATGMRGNIDNTFSIGANADLDQDGVIQKDPDIVGLFPYFSRWAGVRAWQVLRNYSHAAYVSTETIVVPGSMGAGQVVTLVTYTATATAAQENDVVVTLASANPSYAQSLGNVRANHSTMKTRENLERFLNKIKTIR